MSEVMFGGRSGTLTDKRKKEIEKDLPDGVSIYRWPSGYGPSKWALTMISGGNNDEALQSRAEAVVKRHMRDEWEDG